MRLEADRCGEFELETVDVSISPMALSFNSQIHGVGDCSGYMQLLRKELDQRFDIYISDKHDESLFK